MYISVSVCVYNFFVYTNGFKKGTETRDWVYLEFTNIRYTETTQVSFGRLLTEYFLTGDSCKDVFGKEIFNGVKGVRVRDWDTERKRLIVPLFLTPETAVWN